MANNITPLIIEAAVSQYKIDRPEGDQSSVYPSSLIGARESLNEGASIIHYHHDWLLTREQQIEQIRQFQRELSQTHPHALMYPAPMKGQSLWEINEHVKALAQAGEISMFAIEMGNAEFAQLDARGLPSSSRKNFAAADFRDCDELVAFANEYQAPISFGVYSPASIFWLREYAARGLIPAGSFIKIWFAGRYSIGSNKDPQLPFALPLTERALDAYLEVIGDIDMPWMMAVQGDAVVDCEAAQYALDRGGHIRVGVEDMSGASGMSSRETVEAAKLLAAKAGRQVVSGKAARDYLCIAEPALA